MLREFHEGQYHTAGKEGKIPTYDIVYIKCISFTNVHRGDSTPGHQRQTWKGPCSLRVYPTGEGMPRPDYRSDNE